jgi:hypothetical protein
VLYADERHDSRAMADPSLGFDLEKRG